ncbi:DUF6884 domain-containing protein [Polyangium sp. 6x1]|uniref:DUF6884 domain-containing protein n=1 Tax=Polyangium sp. 6x1 TaxID=3042689 RepID=UPI002482D38F|nr:DUF6884 domain-containing protein [Polyangium sp. 6x1]MDI1444632.1 hypothetical protein [Polyangium sp. 6x1]
MFTEKQPGAPRVALVGCSALKGDKAAPAKDFYTSPLFRAAYAYAEATCDAVFIVSAFHGLVEPHQVLEPYDRSLRGLRKVEREDWGARTVGELLPGYHGGPLPVLVLLAGEVYADALRHGAHWHNMPRPEEPLRGIRGVGRRIAWLRNHTPKPRFLPHPDDPGFEAAIADMVSRRQDAWLVYGHSGRAGAPWRVLFEAGGRPEAEAFYNKRIRDTGKLTYKATALRHKGWTIRDDGIAPAVDGITPSFAAAVGREEASRTRWEREQRRNYWGRGAPRREEARPAERTRPAQKRREPEPVAPRPLEVRAPALRQGRAVTMARRRQKKLSAAEENYRAWRKEARERLKSANKLVRDTVRSINGQIQEAMTQCKANSAAARVATLEARSQARKVLDEAAADCKRRKELSTFRPGDARKDCARLGKLARANANNIKAVALAASRDQARTCAATKATLRKDGEEKIKEAIKELAAAEDRWREVRPEWKPRGSTSSRRRVSPGERAAEYRQEQLGNVPDEIRGFCSDNWPRLLGIAKEAKGRKAPYEACMEIAYVPGGDKSPNFEEWRAKKEPTAKQQDRLYEKLAEEAYYASLDENPPPKSEKRPGFRAQRAAAGTQTPKATPRSKRAPKNKTASKSKAAQQAKTAPKSKAVPKAKVSPKAKAAPKSWDELQAERADAVEKMRRAAATYSKAASGPRKNETNSEWQARVAKAKKTLDAAETAARDAEQRLDAAIPF